MSFFAKRPLCLFCSLYLITQLALFVLPFTVKLIVLALAGITLTVAPLILRKRRKPLRYPLLILFAIVTGTTMSIVFLSLPMKQAEDLTAASHQIEGYVTEQISFADYRSVYQVHLTTIDGKSRSQTARLSASTALDLDVYEKFEAEGTFALFAENINGYPERRVMASRGIFSLFEAESVLPLRETVATPTAPFVDFRERLIVILERYIGGRESKLTAALLLADRERLPEEINRDFRALGLSHVLAMSGMHLAMLTGIAERFMQRLRLGKRSRLILLSITILLFTILVGAPLSVVRSAVMLILCYFAEFVHTKQDKVTALMLGVAIICSFSPCAVMDAGLQLSFAAALGITVAETSLTKPLLGILPKHTPRQISGVLSDLSASLAALLFTLPFSTLYFGRISLLSPLATPLVTPFLQINLSTAPFLLITSSLPSVASLFAMLCRLSARCMLAIASTGKWLCDLSLSLDYPFSGMLILVLLAGAVVLFLSGKGTRRRWCALTASFILLYSFGAVSSSFLSRQDSTLICTDNRNKDYLCLSHNGENILCDISDGSYSGIYILTEAMRNRIFDDRFDGIMLTHYHRKHGALLERLSREHYLRRLILPEPETAEEQRYLNDLLLLAEDKKMSVEFYRRGEPFMLCGLTVETIPRSMIKRSTHPLIALKFTGDDRAVAYIGAEAYPEASNFSDALLLLGGHGPRIKDTISLPDGAIAIALSEEAHASLQSGNQIEWIPIFGCILRSLS